MQSKFVDSPTVGFVSGYFHIRLLGSYAALDGGKAEMAFYNLISTSDQATIYCGAYASRPRQLFSIISLEGGYGNLICCYCREHKGSYHMKVVIHE